MQRYYPTIRKTVILLFKMILLFFVLALPVIIKFVSTPEPEYSNLDLYYLLLVYLLAEGWIIRCAIKQMKHPAEIFNRKTNTRKTITFLPFILSGTAALIFLTNPLQQMIPALEKFDGLYKQVHEIKVLSFIYFIIIGPVLEEIIFRGIIMRGFLKNYTPLKAIVLSSVLFSIVHFPFSYIFTILIINFFIGFIFWQTSSLSLSITIHILGNFFVILSSDNIFFSERFDLIFSDTPVFLLLYFIAAIIFFLCIFYIYRKNVAISEVSFREEPL